MALLRRESIVYFRSIPLSRDRTSLVEPTGLFVESVGSHTDIVEKECIAGKTL